MKIDTKLNYQLNRVTFRAEVQIVVITEEGSNSLMGLDPLFCFGLN